MPERSATSTGTNNDGKQSGGGGTYDVDGVAAGDADSGVLRGVGNAVRDSLGVIELVAVTLCELVDVAVASGVVVGSGVTVTAGLPVGDAPVEDVGEDVSAAVADELPDCEPEVDGVLDDAADVVTAGEVVLQGDIVGIGVVVAADEVVTSGETEDAGVGDATGVTVTAGVGVSAGDKDDAGVCVGDVVTVATGVDVAPCEPVVLEVTADELDPVGVTADEGVVVSTGVADTGVPAGVGNAVREGDDVEVGTDEEVRVCDDVCVDDRVDVCVEDVELVGVEVQPPGQTVSFRTR